MVFIVKRKSKFKAEQKEQVVLNMQIFKKKAKYLILTNSLYELIQSCLST